MKIPKNNELFIIADCVEGDYKLYRRLYLKLAKRNKINPNDIYIVTNERIRNLKLNRMGQPFTWMNDKIFMTLLIQSYKKVYVLSNSQRSLVLSKYLTNDQMNRVQIFGYYTNVALVREHYLNKEAAKNVILSNGVICTTSLLPNREYLDNLDFILKYAIEHRKGLIKDEVSN